MDTAKNPARVLNHRMNQRTETAADLVASSSPVALSAAPARTSANAGADLAALGVALELGHQSDNQTRSANIERGTPDDVSTPKINAHADGLTEAQLHSQHAAATGSVDGMLASVHEPATTTAARNYPVAVHQLTAPQVHASTATAATTTPPLRAATVTGNAAARRR